MKIVTPAVVAGVAGKQPEVLRFAARQARLANAGMQVIHATGLTDLATALIAGVDVSDSMQAAGQFVLEDAKQFVKVELGNPDAEFILSGDEPIHTLERAAANASMLILGADDVQWYARLLRTKIAGYLALHAPCPVVVVPESHDRESPDGHVVVTLDGDTAAVGPLRFAFEQASARDTTLHVIHAVPPATMVGDVADLQANMSEILAGWRAEFPDVDVELAFGVGDPQDVVAGLTDRAELVVVGRPHQGTMPFAISRALAFNLLRHAGCAVAVVPADYPGA
ncbi:nucleotide-binding universal stress UspA family protein [Aeromicrobium panaciterrae]|uniref:Nucleotide-binding universal stress UspA family protein n=1 Tax=Aeromicrobium panaciterrae TaxID=363861 RepID=A0ABU1UJA6_9ACTN|nr:universal stress protein [Aeromicrobium panaciterrae]MDR7085220.1 nucleotide-binding universal stress UspA family protein [Aeromicrobium panaciterrae]